MQFFTLYRMLGKALANLSVQDVPRDVFVAYVVRTGSFAIRSTREEDVHFVIANYEMPLMLNTVYIDVHFLHTCRSVH